MTDNLFVLTGAPGTGKTAILSHVGSGLHTVAEPARELIAEHRAANNGMAPEWSFDEFVALLLTRSISKYDSATGEDRPVVFDRAIPDCVAYANHLGADPTASAKAAAGRRCHSDVLMLRPWREIYTTDDERNMTFDQVVSFQNHLEAAYTEAGYRLVEVPRSSLEERSAFVRGFIDERAGI